MTAATPLDPLTFPLQGRRLIEASAGTGKTWTIATLYVRLILGHGDAVSRFDRPLLPSDILVVTFTEAATQELKHRIRERLNAAARWFRGAPNPTDDADAFLRELRQGYPPESLPTLARRLDVAADWMDDAAVYTIHGWCSRMLRQHAFDTGSLFQLNIEGEEPALLLECARDYWRKFFYPLDAITCLAIQSLAKDPDDLLKQIKSLVQSTWVPPATTTSSTPAQLLQAWGDWAARRQALEQQAQHRWANDQAAIETCLRKASAAGWLNGNIYRKAKFEQRLTALAEWARLGSACKQEWLTGFAAGHFKMTAAHLDKTPQHAAFAALAELVAHQEQEPPFRTALLQHATLWVRERFASEKQRQARLDYNDLIHHLDQALQDSGNAALAPLIRQQYPVAMIDEFQDTDPAQYRIFSRIYGAAEATQPLGWFMIGDPKQAIYSFRGADIHAYLQARAATAGHHYTLGTNFRSTQAFVEGVNQFFQYAAGHPEGAFKGKPAEPGASDSMPFFPVAAHGRADALQVDGQTAPAITLWHLEPEGDATGVSTTTYRQRLAAAAADEMARLLNLAETAQAGFADSAGQALRPLQPADIAILVRDRNEAKVIRTALSARGLRSVYLSDRESVFDSSEAKDLLRLLKACANPRQDRLLRAALATTLLGLDYAKLEQINGDERYWELLLGRFIAYQSAWRRLGVLPMLRQLMADFDLPARLLQRENGERSLTNLLHLAELLQAESLQLDGEQGLVRYLATLIAQSDQDTETAILRLESDADLIQVVTIHKAKGLEYPLVFLPFICSYKEVAKKNRSYVQYHDAEAALCIDLELEADLIARADNERLQEDLRLLYVALTRARYACWLGIAPLTVGNNKDCQLHKSAMGYLLGGGATLSASALGARLQALKGGNGDIAVVTVPLAEPQHYTARRAPAGLGPARVFNGKALEHWWIASYSALQLTKAQPQDAAPEAPASPAEANLQEESDTPDTTGPTHTPSAGGRATGGMHQFPHGAKPGVFLHGVLEWVARQGFAYLAQEPAVRRRMIDSRCEKRQWQVWSDTLDQWLTVLLEQSFALPGGPFRLGDLPKRAAQPEMEFWLGAQQVDVMALDRLITQHILPGQRRPSLEANTLNGMLKGFMDLVFEHQGQFYVLDYKSNRLGADPAVYTPDNLAGEVLKKRYDVQYVLYVLALHRYLQARLGAAYDYDRQMGGAVYLFLRGLEGPSQGLHIDKPPVAMIHALDRLFRGTPESRP